MTRHPQGSSELVIRATPVKIWALLEDSTRLAEWAPMVKRTSGTRETLDAVPKCGVGSAVGRGTSSSDVWSLTGRGGSGG